MEHPTGGKGWYLHSVQVLTGVAFHESPFRTLALQQVGAQRHLPTCHVRPQLLANPPAHLQNERLRDGRVGKFAVLIGLPKGITDGCCLYV